MNNASALKAQLIHTWPAFFAQHGAFTPVQMQAIPPILAGRNVLVMAATAAGKTEAALAPLLERCLFAHPPADTPPQPAEPALRLLYICPTRALVRDLHERLATPLEMLGVALAMKSGDTGPVSATNPPTVLITTPESTDSLLTRAPRLFTTLRALALDEIHVFDHSPRGDHLRCLLRRIEAIQRYHAVQSGQATPPLQRVALSATVADPAGVVTRYLTPTVETAPALPPVVVEAPGARRLDAELQPMHGFGDLVQALALRAPSAETGHAFIHKSLVFCNTRNEVEQIATHLRTHPPYAAEIFVHYSNLDPALRREVEARFAEAGVAICVSSSTLELGIDIGSIDEVALVGPPPTLPSFLQRIGRGGRRRAAMRVLCLARSPQEELHFQALLALAQEDAAVMRHAAAFAPTYHFRPSVLVQQLFSLLKQSPTGAVRLADLRRVSPVAMEDETLRRLMGHLTRLGYLQPGRPGEWRPGPTLDPLLDQHEIYSNIGADPLALLVVDAYSGRTLAHTGRLHMEGETLRLGGRTWEVVWRDRYRMAVRPVHPTVGDEQLRFQAAPFAMPLDVAQAIARRLSVARGRIVLVHDERCVRLFHFWGDLYGLLLAELLQTYGRRRDPSYVAGAANGLCITLPAALPTLPAWEAAEAHRELRRLLPRVEPFLGLGRFHLLLPPELAEAAALAHCDLTRFEQLYRAATLIDAPPALAAQLRSV